MHEFSWEGFGENAVLKSSDSTNELWISSYRDV